MSTGQKRRLITDDLVGTLNYKLANYKITYTDGTGFEVYYSGNGPACEERLTIQPTLDRLIDWLASRNAQYFL